MSREEKYLPPASQVILKLASTEESEEDIWRRGIKAASKATGVTYAGVFRWMRPKSAGGRDGLIPSRHHAPIIEYARKYRCPLSHEDFFALSIHRDEASQELIAE